MKIVQLTPGAGGMYCGACMRDNALVAALRRLGHETLLVPLYTPLTTDEPDNSFGRIFFGGLNVFLQQKSALFRNTPEWLDKRLDQPELLRFATGFNIKTSPAELGDLTISMLKGEEGFQNKELDKLLAFLNGAGRADVICLSNVLLSGTARRLRQELRVPIVCTLQGEDFFLDGLPAAQRTAAWDLLRQRVRDIDAFVAVSRYYGELMRERLELPAKKVHVVLNGIDLSGYAPATESNRPAAPTIGYLARLSPEKGARTLVEAFALLRRNNPAARLRLAGSVTPGDRAFVSEIQAHVRRENLTEHVEIIPNLDRAAKIAFLQSLSVLSVPAAYGESFGLYVLEALACGVPVVQPEHGAFPELLRATGGGILCKPGDAQDLADKIGELLAAPKRRAELGAKGRQSVLENFGIDRVARDVAGVLTRVTESKR